jgi:hypothetical protein
MSVRKRTWKTAAGEERSIPLSLAVYGQMGFNTHAFNDAGQLAALRNLIYVVQEAVKFLHQQATSNQT